jgi:hypothetical protein
VGELNQPGVLIVSDDPSFARAVTARWEQASLAPDVTLATSDVWATAIGERYDVVIVGPLHDEIAAALLEALAEQSVSSVIFVSDNDRLLSSVAKFHPNVITISRKGEWLEVLRTASLEALGRTEAADVAAQSASPDENRCAQLGRYMLNARPSWNNALTSVLGNADLLLLDPGSVPEAFREQIQAIQTMALRLHEIMQGFSSLDSELRASETTSHPETLATGRAFASVRH